MHDFITGDTAVETILHFKIQTADLLSNSNSAQKNHINDNIACGGGGLAIIFVRDCLKNKKKIESEGGSIRVFGPFYAQVKATG